MLLQIHDAFALSEETEHEYGVSLTPFAALKPADAVILAVAHDEYVAAGWSLVTGLLKDGRGIVLDVKSKLDRNLQPEEIELWRL